MADGFFTHALLLVAFLIIARFTAGPTEVKSEDSKPKSYLVVREMMSFNKSVEYCKNKRMRLATFKNKAELRQMADKITKGGYNPGNSFWSAGVKQVQNKRTEWRWTTTDSIMDFKPWDTREPRAHTSRSGEKSGCVSVRFLGQSDPLIFEWYCSATFRPVCES